MKINKELKDTLNLFLSYKLLGAVGLHLRQFEEATKNLRNAENLSAHVPEEYTTEIKMYQAAVCHHKNEIERALDIIRPLPQLADSLSRNIVLAYASDIYQKAGVFDTAYIYAQELALSRFPDNRKTGYKVMLSPEIRHLVPSDSLACLYDDYKEVLETTFRQQEDTHALIQNCMYNYQKHDRQKQEAERKKGEIIIFVMALIAVISILSGFILLLLYRGKRQVVKLHNALAKLEFIENAQKTDQKNSLGPSNKERGDEENTDESGESQIIKDEQTLKYDLRNKYRIIKEKSKTYDLSPRILTSRPYIRLQSQLKSKSPLPNGHNIFVELGNVISECYPEFKSRLQLLADGNLKEEEFEMSMLIRCGFTPKELSFLLGRSNSTVSYRRKKLCRKLLGEESDLESLDTVIRSL